MDTVSKRGFTVTEAVVAVLVLATVLLAYYSLTQTTVRSVAQTRNYALATVAAENAIEEILAHPYGQPLPEKGWSFDPKVIIGGRASSTPFAVSVETDLKGGGNGSFLGKSQEDYDFLTVTVSWREPEPSGVGSREQRLDFQLTVRRQYEL